MNTPSLKIMFTSLKIKATVSSGVEPISPVSDHFLVYIFIKMGQKEINFTQELASASDTNLFQTFWMQI